MNIAMIPPLSETPMPWACPQCRERAVSTQQRALDNAEFLSKYERLSPREREVAIAICAGESPQSCADRLGISVKTVHTFRGRILEKLGLTANTQIAVAFQRAGILDEVSPPWVAPHDTAP